MDYPTYGQFPGFGGQHAGASAPGGPGGYQGAYQQSGMPGMGGIPGMRGQPGVMSGMMGMPGQPGAMHGMQGQPGGFPGHAGGFPQASPFSAQDPLWPYFTAVAGQDGQIDFEELQRCLSQAGISGSYRPFSLETCKIMIAMLDRDMSGKMGFSEFKDLWVALNGWKRNFVAFDRDQSGCVDPAELTQALSSMGYRLSNHTIGAIVKRYSRDGKIFFDDYVACCVKLRALTDRFKERDVSQQAIVNFPYDDFIKCTMSI
uniref:Grancalcin n=1 Tax=Eptatretus burgeri TaxID=7764 RepID=A0A8C4QBD7_EPTBU